MTSTPKLDGHGWLLIGILAILWGGTFFLIEVGLRSFPPITLVFIRVAFAVPPMWIAMRVMGQSLPTSGRVWSLLAVVGALNCALPFTLFFWGQQYLDSGYASILNATTPLWGVITAHFLTNDEKAAPARIIGVLTGMAGIIVMVGPEAMNGLSNNLLAQIACVISTIFYSLAAIYGRRLSQTTLTPMAVATGAAFAAAHLFKSSLLASLALLGAGIAVRVVLAALRKSWASSRYFYCLQPRYNQYHNSRCRGLDKTRL